MNELIQKLINENKIQFQHGNFLLFGFANNAITLTNLAVFFSILDEKYPEAEHIIREIGKKTLKSAAKLIIRKFSSPLNSEQISILLKYLGLFGYGDFRIVNINSSQKKVIIEIKNSQYCAMYMKLFGQQKKDIMHFTSGICEGISELILGCSATARETSCIAKGNESCFMVGEKCPEKNELIPKFSGDLFQRLSQAEKSSDEEQEFIKKVAGHDMIFWQDGIFSIWRAPGFILPTISLAFIIKTLEEKFGKYTGNLFYHAARVQSREALLLQIKSFGFKKDKALLQSMFEHPALTGFGISKIDSMDFDEKVIRFRQHNNPYPRIIKEIFGTEKNPADDFVAGLAVGTIEGFFEMLMQSDEKECIASGSESCLFEITPKKTEKYPLEKKHLDIIEGKIIAKNFVL